MQALLVDDKWMAALEARIGGETARVAQGLTRRLKELSERYTAPLPALAENVAGLEAKIAAHLMTMGFA